MPAECFGANGEEFAKEDSVESLDLQPGDLALVVDKPPEKPVAAPSQVSSPASSPKFSMTSLLGPMPSIFNRILKSKVPTQPTQDDELLEEAMAVVREKLFFNPGKLFFNLKAFFQPWKSFFQPCRSFFQPWKAFFSTLPNCFFTLPGSFQP